MNDTAAVGERICKVYASAESSVPVLDDVGFEFDQGSFVVIEGHSGSGKTTLLNIISSVDRPTSGRIRVFDEELTEKDDDFLATFRCEKVGYVFQNYNLVSTLTVAENIAFPMEWLRTSETQIRERVHELLTLIELEQRAHHFPFQLSGGEQQRVAFARAIANDPPLILADEPTGNLDEATSLKIVEIMKNLQEEGRTIVAATHDKSIRRLSSQRFLLTNGKLMKKDE